MRIIISPFSQKLRNGNKNAKNYPAAWWREIIYNLQGKGHEVIQIGVKGEDQMVPDFRVALHMKELQKLLLSADTFISVDNFLPHMASYLQKSGYVIWGVSSPFIFGYTLHTNILKDPTNLRPNQFDIWEGVPYREDVFPEPSHIIKYFQKKTNA